MRPYQILITILLSGFGQSACINEDDDQPQRRPPSQSFTAWRTNDPLERGDPEYPLRNPAPTQVVQFTALIPATLSSEFHLRYEIEVGKSPLPAFIPSQSPSGCRWTEEKQFHVDMVLALTSSGDRYTGSFSSDLFQPGSCRWHLDRITTPIADTPLVSFQHSPAAGPPPSASLDLTTDVRHLWCTRHVGTAPVAVRNQRPNCVPYTDIGLWRNLPDGFGSSIPASQKEAGSQVADQRLRSLTVELHDVDALVAAYLGRQQDTSGQTMPHAETVDCKKASTEVEHAICDNKPLRELDAAFAKEVNDPVPQVVRPEHRVDFLWKERQLLAARDVECAPLGWRKGRSLSECLTEYDRAGITYLRDMKRTDAVWGWIRLENPDDSGELLIDVTLVDVTGLQDPMGEERHAYKVRLIPKPHTTDGTTMKPILYEEMSDEFNCRAGTAFRTSLDMYYEDGTSQGYMPWGNAISSPPWRTVRSGTALDSERNFICGLQLTADSPAAAKVGEERIFGTWHVKDDAHREISGPVVISGSQMAWTLKDNHPCAINYRLVARSVGSTFPGESLANDKPEDAYTTFVLDPGPKSCAPWWGPVTISLPSGHTGVAYFFARLSSQYGTLKRASQD